MLEFHSAQASDAGRVRGNNEDLVYSDEGRGIFIVIDGMGGQAAGEHAARIALDRLRRRLERQTGAVEERIREAIALANNAVFEAAQGRPEWHGMACVLTLAVIENGKATIGHVGDSRLYKIHRGAMRKLTHDHSPVGEREDSGELTEDQAMRHPRRNEVYRDVGSAPRDPHDPQFIEIIETAFEPDAALLLASDGLTDYVPSARILRLIQENAGDGDRVVRALIDAANESSKDNISVVYVEGAKFAPRPATRSGVDDDAERTAPLGKRPKTNWYYLAVAAVIAAAGVLGAWLLLNRPAENNAPQKLLVPSEATPTIAEALRRARSGDSIEIAPGHYRERIRLKEGVDIIARSPRQAVILPPPDARSAAAAITADGIGKARVVGLAIAGAEGGALGIGAAVRDSNVTFERMEISGATIAGMEFDGDSQGAVQGSYIHHNAGPAIVIRHAAAPALENNLLVNNGNTKANPQPAILITSSNDPVIDRNTITGSGAEAIWSTRQVSAAVLEANKFTSDGKPPRDRRRLVRLIPGGAQ
jgi:serine/threonine protein phosphatase PrpC